VRPLHSRYTEKYWLDGVLTQACESDEISTLSLPLLRCFLHQNRAEFFILFQKLIHFIGPLETPLQNNLIWDKVF